MLRPGPQVTLGVAGLFLAGFACWSGSAANQLTITVTTNYYSFGGTNHSQMRFAMIEARPWKQTLTFDAKTDWNVQSNYSFQRDGDQFVLDALRVRAKVVVTLPSWNPGQRVKPDLVARWVQCFRGLSRHEQGHVELARAAAAEVQRRLDSLPACASAEELTAAAERTLNRTLEEFRQKERTYDQVTKHGITQGAVFPMTNLEARE